VQKTSRKRLSICSVPDKVKICSLVSYKIKNLDEDIERNKKLTKEEKKKAKKRWGQLKLEVNPERFQILIEEIQNLRNTSAHPEITDEIKDIVFKAAEELPYFIITSHQNRPLF
jgi:tRNA pseudouridine-54 N-methylase